MLRADVRRQQVLSALRRASRATGRSRAGPVVSELQRFDAPADDEADAAAGVRRTALVAFGGGTVLSRVACHRLPVVAQNADQDLRGDLDRRADRPTGH